MVTIPMVMCSALQWIGQKSRGNGSGADQAAAPLHGAQPGASHRGSQRPAPLGVCGKPDARLVVSVGKPGIAGMRDGAFMRPEKYKWLGHVRDLFVASGGHQIKKQV